METAVDIMESVDDIWRDTASMWAHLPEPGFEVGTGS